MKKGKSQKKQLMARVVMLEVCYFLVLSWTCEGSKQTYKHISSYFCGWWFPEMTHQGSSSLRILRLVFPSDFPWRRQWRRRLLGFGGTALGDTPRGACGTGQIAAWVLMFQVSMIFFWDVFMLMFQVLICFNMIFDFWMCLVHFSGSNLIFGWVLDIVGIWSVLGYWNLLNP